MVPMMTGGKEIMEGEIEDMIELVGIENTIVRVVQD